MTRWKRGFGVVLLAGAAVGRPVAAGHPAYHALGIEPKDVLAGTVLTGRVLPGQVKQVVCLATYLTGKRDEEDAVNVRLGIFDRRDEALIERYTRDFGAENGGHVANGDLQLLDLDRDGIHEIIVSFDNFEDPLIDERLSELILYEDGSFRTGWSGPIEYDATRAARSVPVERRDRFVREFDISNTIRTRGVTLFIDKKMIAVAGERLPEPRIIQETFPLRPYNEP